MYVAGDPGKSTPTALYHAHNTIIQETYKTKEQMQRRDFYFG